MDSSRVTPCFSVPHVAMRSPTALTWRTWAVAPTSVVHHVTRGAFSPNQRRSSCVAVSRASSFLLSRDLLAAPRRLCVVAPTPTRKPSPGRAAVVTCEDASPDGTAAPDVTTPFEPLDDGPIVDVRVMASNNLKEVGRLPGWQVRLPDEDDVTKSGVWPDETTQTGTDRGPTHETDESAFQQEPTGRQDARASRGGGGRVRVAESESEAGRSEWARERAVELERAVRIDRTREVHMTRYGPRRTDRPLMVLLPGLDGSIALMDGGAQIKWSGVKQAKSQNPRLSRFLQHFDTCSVIIPSQDRSTWDELVDKTAELIREEIQADGQRRPVYLKGISFGGCLALLIASKYPELVDRMVLVNPASSYRDSFGAPVWWLLQYIPEDIYNALPKYLAPLFFNFQDPKLNKDRAIKGMMSLPEQLPSATLGHRIDLLQSWPQPAFENIRASTLVIVGEQDILLPSLSESERLARLLPNAQRHVILDKGHALVGVDILQIMKDYNFA